MKIALFGAAGNIGQRTVQEALARGHSVTAIVRDPSHFTLAHPQLKVVKGNAANPADVVKVVGGQEVVISAIGPGPADSPQILVDAARSLLEGLKRAGVKRLIVVGGAGSLEVAPGVQLIDTPEFPASWKPVAQAHRDALAIYRQNANLDWTYVSPAAQIAPGERTGKYRTGTDQLLQNAAGQSVISMEDFAVALLDEAEHPKFIRRRFTAAH